MNYRPLRASLEHPGVADWRIEESRMHRGYHASLGDIVAHNDTYYGVAQSLAEKLELYRQRLLSIGKPPLIATGQYRDVPYDHPDNWRLF